MRISEKDLSQTQIQSLSRTTRWRLEKRGWISVAKEKGINTNNFCLYVKDIERESTFLLNVVKDWIVPSYMDWDDLLQEMRLHIFLFSSSKEFHSHSWRMKVMQNRLRDFRKKGMNERLAVVEFLRNLDSHRANKCDDQWVDAVLSYLESQLNKTEMEQLERFLGSQAALKPKLQQKLCKIFQFQGE